MENALDLSDDDDDNFGNPVAESASSREWRELSWFCVQS